MIKIKRVYEKPSKDDGFRILIDRLWPHGLSKEKAKIHLWLKDVAVSSELRKWFSHDPQKWTQFKRRFYAELRPKKDAIAMILDKVKTEANVTLLYASKEEKFNNAVALLEYINSKLKKKAVQK